MKGLIFIVVVTLAVLASFARPEKQVSSPSPVSREISAKSQSAIVRDTMNVVHKQGS